VKAEEKKEPVSENPSLGGIVEECQQGLTSVETEIKKAKPGDAPENTPRAN